MLSPVLHPYCNIHCILLHSCHMFTCLLWTILFTYSYSPTVYHQVHSNISTPTTKKNKTSNAFRYLLKPIWSLTPFNDPQPVWMTVIAPCFSKKQILLLASCPSITSTTTDTELLYSITSLPNSICIVLYFIPVTLTHLSFHHVYSRSFQRTQPALVSRLIMPPGSTPHR